MYGMDTLYMMKMFEEFQNDYNWKKAFAFGRSPNRAPPDANMDSSGFTIHDIRFIVAADEGENDGKSWLAVVALKDGRYGMIDASCDYTGWDCRCWGSSAIATSLADIIRYGLSAEKRERLKLSLID
jgi:hypothetical protein